MAAGSRSSKLKQPMHATYYFTIYYYLISTSGKNSNSTINSILPQSTINYYHDAYTAILLVYIVYLVVVVVWYYCLYGCTAYFDFEVRGSDNIYTNIIYSLLPLPLNGCRAAPACPSYSRGISALLVLAPAGAASPGRLLGLHAHRSPRS